MAWVFCFAFVLTAVLIVVGFSGGELWFPVAVSDFARDYDDQFVLTLLLTGFFFVLLHLVLAFIVVRFRPSTTPRSTWRGNMRWVWATIAIMAVLDLGLALGSEELWGRLHLNEGAVEPIVVEAIGQQFVWNIRYPGPDGVFGRTDVRFVNDELGNPLGVDPEDPAGRDDINFPTLVVPVGQPIELKLGSKDVLHSFFMRELRIKQDAVPGILTTLRFTADTLGRYEVPCAELCGLGHHRMRTFLEVVEQSEYEARLQEYLDLR